MKNQYSILFFSLALVCSCKKTHTSNWKIGNESFVTDATNYRVLFSGTVFETYSRENGFNILFHNLDYGACDIGSYIPFGQGGMDLSFYYHNNKYIPLHNGSTQMNVSDKDGKTTFAIPSTWFIRLEYDSSGLIIPNNDTVLIQGVLSEP